MTLTCNVKRSNPHPHNYHWWKDGTDIGSGKTHVVKCIQPENHGTYKCTATNTVGIGTSELFIKVACKFHSSFCRVYVRELMMTEKRKWIHRLYPHRKHTKSYFLPPDSPRKTNITKHARVKVGNSLTFYCNTDAYPPPEKYSWYRYNKNKQIDSSLWKSKTTEENNLHLDIVQRADEACYMCNATNGINTGENSEATCIQVLCK